MIKLDKLPRKLLAEFPYTTEMLSKIFRLIIRHLKKSEKQSIQVRLHGSFLKKGEMCGMLVPF